MESLGNNIKPGSLNPINASRIIPISIKLQAIEYAEKNGNHKAAIAYNVNRSTIIYWRNHKNEYNNVDNPEKRITLHNGKSPLFPMEKVLYFLISKINYTNFLNLIENWEIVLQQDLWFISF